jgi:hypothetical protein
MRKQPGWVFRKRYTHRAVVLRKRQRLESAMDTLVARLEKHFEVTGDGNLKIKSASQPRQRS